MNFSANWALGPFFVAEITEQYSTADILMKKFFPNEKFERVGKLKPKNEKSSVTYVYT